LDEQIAASYEVIDVSERERERNPGKVASWQWYCNRYQQPMAFVDLPHHMGCERRSFRRRAASAKAKLPLRHCLVIVFAYLFNTAQGASIPGKIAQQKKM
jgi:hypothetical protein